MMNATVKFALFSSLFLFLGCKEEQKIKPKVNYDNKPKTEKKTPAVVNTLLVADLPVQMDGTNVLIHPIGEFSVRDSLSRGKYSSGERESFVVSNYAGYEITGYLSNLKFQEVGSDSLKVLTDKPIMIERVTYLKTFADKTKKQFLVYVLEDMDSNKDGKLDGNDIKDLYISTINGANFTKLSSEFHELIDWNILEAQNRLYFRTIEDTNKNGAFDKDDKIHYQYVDLLGKELKVAEYFPFD